MGIGGFTAPFIQGGIVNEHRAKNRGRRRVPDLVPDLHPGDGGGDLGHDGLETLVKAPNWWPFTYTTKEGLQALKKQRKVSEYLRLLKAPPAPF